MSAQVEQTFETPVGKYLVDPYENWASEQGVPIHKGAALDLRSVATNPWTRFGTEGAICHLDGRCDFLTVFLLELAPGEATKAQHHLYEELCYVVSGQGATEIEGAGGGSQRLEWGPGSLVAVPMNARHRHVCESGGPARLAVVNDLRYLLNLYRNERFLFETPLFFAERGPGEVVRDLATRPVDDVGDGHERRSTFALAQGSIGADLIELAPGTYGAARRQMFGSLLFGIAGHGKTLSWSEDPQKRERHDWSSGMLYAPMGMSFHQHFNLGSEPARFLRVEFGSRTYPILRPRKHAYGDTRVYASGSAVIAPGDEPASIREEWQAELARSGTSPRM